eukprot:Plantae.Rhodophyta-Hildenbrandia_rubra.ctg2166.p1 GENE.Plantae.Rhodophyta-Hildenbrandia_rubra.ctg2166~~Plantae.Rhodophyta-Hildenbrandia_rubra.ctg2166.p1  ORF type:complete len:1046 (+),score=186.63 Plantae.Rhodophyta-Hildenbrandia_rubra.ctg2166:618-3755(+)
MASDGAGAAGGFQTWQQGMTKNDRLSVCRHVLTKLEALFRSMGKQSSPEDLKQRTAEFEKSTFAKAVTRKDYLVKIAEGLKKIDDRTKHNLEQKQAQAMQSLNANTPERRQAEMLAANFSSGSDPRMRTSQDAQRAQIKAAEPIAQMRAPLARYQTENQQRHLLAQQSQGLMNNEQLMAANMLARGGGMNGRSAQKPSNTDFMAAPIVSRGVQPQMAFANQIPQNDHANMSQATGVTPESLLRLKEQMQAGQAQQPNPATPEYQKFALLMKTLNPEQRRLLYGIIPNMNLGNVGSPAQEPNSVPQQMPTAQQNVMTEAAVQEQRAQAFRQQQVLQQQLQYSQSRRQVEMQGRNMQAGHVANGFVSTQQHQLPPHSLTQHPLAQYPPGHPMTANGTSHLKKNIAVNDMLSNNAGQAGQMRNAGNLTQAQLVALENAKATNRQRQRQVKAHLQPQQQRLVASNSGPASAKQQRSDPASDQLKSAMQAAANAGIPQADVINFLKSQDSSLRKVGITNYTDRLRVMTANLHSRTRELLAKRRDHQRVTEQAIWNKLQNIRNKYKPILMRMKPAMDKLQARGTTPIKPESFQKHLSDCFNLLNWKPSSNRPPPKLDLKRLQGVEKFLTYVIIVYSKFIKGLISNTGPHSPTRDVLLRNFDAQLGNFAREIELDIHRRRSESLPRRGTPVDSSRTNAGLPRNANTPNTGQNEAQAQRNGQPVLQNSLVQPGPTLANKELQGLAHRTDAQQNPDLKTLPSNRTAYHHSPAQIHNEHEDADEQPLINRHAANRRQAQDSISKINAAALLPQRVARVEMDVKVAVREATLLEKFVDAEVGKAKSERVQNTLAALQIFENDERDNGNISSESGDLVGQKRARSVDSPDIDNVSYDSDGVLESQVVFECSCDEGLRLAKRVKSIKTDMLFLKSAVEEECKAAVTKNPILVVSIEEEFGFPVVHAMLNIESIKLPKLIISVQRGYPRKGGAEYGFERPPFGFTGVLEKLYNAFKVELERSPARFYSVAGILNAWARKADLICNESKMANAQDKNALE